MTHAVIYSRFSPRRDAEEAMSCLTQESLCRETIAAKGWTEKSAHRDEAVSGGTEVEQREGLMAAVEDLKKGDVLLVYHRDRLARDAFLAEVIRRMVAAKGARIEACTGEAVRGDDESPEARFVRGVLDLVAQLYREMGAARTKASMLSQQRSGRRMSKHPPYGKRACLEDPERWEDDPREQVAVRRARALAAEGLTAWGIAKKLTEELPGHARNGAKWKADTVKRIVARA